MALRWKCRQCYEQQEDGTENKTHQRWGGTSLRLLPEFNWFRSLLALSWFSPLTQVDLAHPVGVDWITLVGIHHLVFFLSIMGHRTKKKNDQQKRRECYHNEETGVGVDHLRLVSGLQVPEDGGIVEEGQVHHVLALLKLGWVNSTHFSCLEPGICGIWFIFFYKVALTWTSRVQRQQPSWRKDLRLRLRGKQCRPTGWD